MQLTARPVTAPAARNHRPRPPGPSRTGPFPLGPPPGAAPGRQPGTVDSGAFSDPAGRRVGRPARRHRRASRTGRGRGHRQPRQLIARSVRWRERDMPRKHPAICLVTSSRPPKPAGLPPAWLHLTVTAWRPSVRDIRLICAADPDLKLSPRGIPIWTMCVTTGPHGGTASRGQGGASSVGSGASPGASRYGPFGRVGGSSEFEPTGFTARRLFWPARPGWSRPRWLGVVVGVLTPLQGPGQAEEGE